MNMKKVIDCVFSFIAIVNELLEQYLDGKGEDGYRKMNNSYRIKKY